MAINFAKEYKKFEEKQRELRRDYLKAGMTEEQIRAMYEFDRIQMNRDLAYRRRTQPLHMEDDDFDPDEQNTLLKDYDDRFSVSMEPDKEKQFWWLNELEDDVLYESLLKLSYEDLMLIDMIAFQEQTQAQISVQLKVSQSSISQRLKTIRKKMKK